MSTATKSAALAKVAAKRTVPVLAVADLGKQAKKHWDSKLSARQRRRLVTLLRRSHGNPRNLTSRQRKEVASIVRDLDAVGLGRQLAVTAAGIRRARRTSRV